MGRSPPTATRSRTDRPQLDTKGQRALVTTTIIDTPNENFHLHELTVPETDIDQQGHVNNVAYLRWAQDAAVAHSDAVGWCSRRYQEAGVSWVVRSHQIRYKQPAMLGDNIVVRTWIETTRNASCERQYEITRASDAAVLATAMTEWAFVDLKTARPKRIPPDLAADFA